MPDEVDPDRFFDAYPAFLDSSETGPLLDRLNARQRLLIHDQRHLLDGARVLDLACHDGRFSFAALQAGASHVTGIDHKGHLLRVAGEHMDRYGVAPDRYRFLAGDLFDCLEQVGPVDVVLVFGILYHLCDHVRLFDAVAGLDPAAAIVDTRVSRLDGAVLEVRSPLGQSPPDPGSALELYPTRAALIAVLSSFGWEVAELDWLAGGRAEGEQTRDYRSGDRASFVVTCPERAVDPVVRREAVERVLAKAPPLEKEATVVAMVAGRFGIPAPALRTWVAHARRQRARDAGFAV